MRHPRRAVGTLAAISLLSACSVLGMGGEPDPAGLYSLSASVDGEPTSARMRIVRTGDGFSGSVESELASFEIREVLMRQDDFWLVRATGSEGELEIRFSFQGARAVVGTWTLGSLGGRVSGMKVDGSGG